MQLTQQSMSNNSELASDDLIKVLERLYHDSKQPLTTVKMFIDVIDEIHNNPQELELWKKNLLLSFTRFEALLEEMQLKLNQLTAEKNAHE